MLLLLCGVAVVAVAVVVVIVVVGIGVIPHLSFFRILGSVGCMLMCGTMELFILILPQCKP